MLSGPPSIRLWIVASVLVGATVLLHTVSHGEAIVARQPLRQLPSTIGAYVSQEDPLPERIVQALGVSDYTNRLFVSLTDLPVQLYVGYYASQRTGDTIHSPKNCLPGAGWDPIRSGYATITLSSGRQIVVNEYVIAQGLNKQLVFYWYQGRGRVIASEYAGKFWMVTDAISRNRTDGALVRLVTPINDTEDKARARLESFTKLVFPRLDELIPN